MLQPRHCPKPCVYVCVLVSVGLTAPTGLCAAGFVCVSGANQSAPPGGPTGHECQPGYYCPAGSAQGRKCPLGTFSSQLGLENITECEACTPGTYCQTEGTPPAGGGGGGGGGGGEEGGGGGGGGAEFVTF